MKILKILLVEDDEDNYVRTKTLLENAFPQHYQLSWAANMQQARVEIRQTDFHVLQFDCSLGTGTGLEFANEVSSTHANSVPIIFLTNKESTETEGAALKAGVSDCIVKQELTSLLLKKSIRYAIARSKAQLAQQENAMKCRGHFSDGKTPTPVSDRRGR